MFRRISEVLHSSLDGLWQLRAKHTLAGIAVPGTPWEVWRRSGDTWLLVVEAPTVATLAAAMTRAAAPTHDTKCDCDACAADNMLSGDPEAA